MENFRKTKSLRNILEGLKSNVGIFRGPFTYLTLNSKANMSASMEFDLFSIKTNSLIYISQQARIVQIN